MSKPFDRPQAAWADQPDGTKRPSLFDQLRAMQTPRLGWALGALAVMLLLFLAVNNVLLWQRVNALQVQAPGGKAHMVHLIGTQNAPRPSAIYWVLKKIIMAR